MANKINSGVKQRNNIVSFAKKPFSYFMGLSGMRKIIILVVLALLIIWRVSASRNNIPKLDTATVSRGNLEQTVSASGDIKADEIASMTFQTIGVLEKLNVKTGDHVRKNDILAKIDTTDLYAAYKSAEATLRATQATLDHTYDMIQGHTQDESFAQKDTRTAAETAKDKAYWAYVVAKKDFDGAIIKTPFDGIVVQTPQNIYPGIYVGLPTSLNFIVVNPDTIYFRAEVDELDISKVYIGQKANIDLDSYPNDTFEGEVTNAEYGNITSSTGGTAYQIRVSVPGNDVTKFRFGMNGNVQIIVNTINDALYVPQTAVVESGGKSYVWVINSGNVVHKTEVETGTSSTDNIQITKGLSEGDVIVITPPINLKEGEKVRTP